MKTDVYLSTSRQITVSTNQTKETYLYNPDTKFVLVPADEYSTNSDLMRVLRNSDLVDGIYNHQNITQP
jgi:hypothetical protein